MRPAKFNGGAIRRQLNFCVLLKNWRDAMRLGVTHRTELRRIVHAPNRRPALEANVTQIAGIKIGEIFSSSESDQMRALQLSSAEHNVLA
jgi:hypothetical protein